MESIVILCTFLVVAVMSFWPTAVKEVPDKVRIVQGIDMTRMPLGIKDTDAAAWIRTQYKGRAVKGMRWKLAWEILFQWRDLQRKGLAADQEEVLPPRPEGIVA